MVVDENGRGSNTTDVAKLITLIKEQLAQDGIRSQDYRRVMIKIEGVGRAVQERQNQVLPDQENPEDGIRFAP